MVSTGYRPTLTPGPTRHLVAAIFGVLLTTVFAAKAATPLMIWPVDPVIAGEQRAVALWVENRGSEPLVLQARVFAWHQDQGDDHFSPQQTVVSSPPISQIPPGARQMVRLIATRPIPAGQEQAFRVLLDELPTPLSAADTAFDPQRAQALQSQLGVRLQIRYALPLFVYAPGTSGPRMPAAQAGLLPGVGSDDMLAPSIHWKTEQDASGVHYLVVHNTGRGHARLTAVGWRVPGSDSTVTINPGLMGYVLAHSHRRWPLPGPAPKGQELQATVNGRATPLPRAPQ